MVSFKGKTPPGWVLDGLKQGTVSSLCLFAYNIDSPVQLRELTETLHYAARQGKQPPPLVGIDQEGGQLMAVTGGATELPGNMALGAARSPELAFEAGRVLGLELLAMGCTLNFAPVLDLSDSPNNPAVGVRAFSDEPKLTAELGAALIRGMQSTGIIAVAKHFPGHGNTATDSHHAMPVVRSSLAELEARELVPFRAAIEGGVGGVMSAHIAYPQLSDDAPATFSAPILKGLLRERLGFSGLIVTDALDMHAVADLGPRERSVAALRAGADLVLLGHLPHQETLLKELAGEFDPTSAERIERARRRLPVELPSLELIGSGQHKRVAQAIADTSVTLLRGKLPLDLEPEARLAVITVQVGNLTPADTSSAVAVRLAERIRVRHSNTQTLNLPYLAEPATLREVLEAARGAASVVVGTVNAHHDPAQAELVNVLQQRGLQPVVVALRTPYDLLAFPEVDTYLCAYGIRDASTEAVAKVLFGEMPARGHLPVKIPELVNI